MSVRVTRFLGLATERRDDRSAARATILTIGVGAAGHSVPAYQTRQEVRRDGINEELRKAFLRLREEYIQSASCDRTRLPPGAEEQEGSTAELDGKEQKRGSRCSRRALGSNQCGRSHAHSL